MELQKSRISNGVSQEARNCQNCHKDFTIEPEDFLFYEKIKVPAPTFCPECRRQRRFCFRNERSLYKRKCDLCKKEGISMYSIEVPFPVYCHECWWSDKWDSSKYGLVYNFSNSFFKQFQNLLNQVPRLGLFLRNSIHSPYANMIGESKNVYLSYSIVMGSENVFYSKSVNRSVYAFDCFNVTNSEQIYENISSEQNYSCNYLMDSRQCINSQFLFNCVNCRNCFLCANLRNKEYFIRNKSYSKEEYFKILGDMNLGSFEFLESTKKAFMSLRLSVLHRYANILKSFNSTGDDISNAKNAKFCFEGYDIENAKYCFRTPGIKDCMDTDFQGIHSELIYEYIIGGKNDYFIKFSIAQLENVRNTSYSDYCFSSFNLFACVGLRNKQYCILNKQYSKEEYESLFPR